MLEKASKSGQMCDMWEACSKIAIQKRNIGLGFLPACESWFSLCIRHYMEP